MVTTKRLVFTVANVHSIQLDKLSWNKTAESYQYRSEYGWRGKAEIYLLHLEEPITLASLIRYVARYGQSGTGYFLSTSPASLLLHSCNPKIYKLCTRMEKGSPLRSFKEHVKQMALWIACSCFTLWIHILTSITYEFHSRSPTHNLNRKWASISFFSNLTQEKGKT